MRKREASVPMRPLLESILDYTIYTLRLVLVLSVLHTIFAVLAHVILLASGLLVVYLYAVIFNVAFKVPALSTCFSGVIRHLRGGCAWLG